jgi:hypothetical protein
MSEPVKEMAIRLLEDNRKGKPCTTSDGRPTRRESFDELPYVLRWGWLQAAKKVLKTQ